MNNSKEIIDIQPQFKLWLVIKRENRKIILGKGKADILEAIKNEGSIKGASESLGLNFKTVWKRTAELRRGDPGFLMEVSKGGITKGGTVLTPGGHQLLKRFRQLENTVERAIKLQDTAGTTGIKVSAFVKEVLNEGEEKIILQLEIPGILEVEIPKKDSSYQDITPGKKIVVELDFRLVDVPESSTEQV